MVDATLAALEAPPGSPYGVGGGDRATVNELIAYVQHTLGKRVEVTYGPAAEGDVRFTWTDLKRVGRELGYWLWVGLEEGIKAQVEWALEERIASGPVGGGPGLTKETT